MMRLIDRKKVAPSICEACGAIVHFIEIVETLPGRGCGLSMDHAEPAETGDRCPVCEEVTSFVTVADAAETLYNVLFQES